MKVNCPVVNGIRYVCAYLFVFCCFSSFFQFSLTFVMILFPLTTQFYAFDSKPWASNYAFVVDFVNSFPIAIATVTHKLPRHIYINVCAIVLCAYNSFHFICLFIALVYQNRQ